MFGTFDRKMENTLSVLASEQIESSISDDDDDDDDDDEEEEEEEEEEKHKINTRKYYCLLLTVYYICHLGESVNESQFFVPSSPKQPPVTPYSKP
jgi:TATA-binding protein-associated factor Taf7